HLSTIRPTLTSPTIIATRVPGHHIFMSSVTELATDITTFLSSKRLKGLVSAAPKLTPTPNRIPPTSIRHPGTLSPSVPPADLPKLQSPRSKTGSVQNLLHGGREGVEGGALQRRTLV
ncbi:hypothetical protein Vretimale_12947, partial [Volvox reticuliferus]